MTRSTVDAPVTDAEWLDWEPVAAASALNEAKASAAQGFLPVRWRGVPWLVTRLDGTWVAFRDECPHRRVPLSAGRVVPRANGSVVECGYHGWQFAASGQCAHIPALGDAAPASGMRVDVAAVRVVDGLLWFAVRSDPGTGAAPAAGRR